MFKETNPWAKYYNQGASTIIAHTMNGAYVGSFGLKGYGIGVDYTVAKNMMRKIFTSRYKTAMMRIMITIGLRSRQIF